MCSPRFSWSIPAVSCRSTTSTTSLWILSGTTSRRFSAVRADSAMLLDERKWYRLNETNVARLPAGGGVYELSGSGAIVLYIGWADDGMLRDTVRGHIKDPRNECIGRNAF